MSKISLIWDVESTGFPVWSSPSGGEEQPHLVQLAALLVDDDTLEILESMDVIVAPDGWVSDPEALEVHGITEERAMEEGIPEKEALEMFIVLWLKSDIRVAHNTTFDNRIIRIALKRYLPDLVTDELWKDKTKYFCTLQKAKKIMGGKSGHTLPETYAHFVGGEFEDAHNALADAKACMEIYYAMKLLE